MGTKPTEARSNGARRSSRAHKAILGATLEILVEAGYQGLTIEGVAGRAGVGKATVYRWWPSKGALVSEALIQRLTTGPPPDSGDILDDLLAVVRTTIENYSTNIAGLVVPALASDLAHDPEAKSTFVDNFIGPRRAVCQEVLQRAIAAGVLPPTTDVALVLDVWAGTVFYRQLLSGGETGEQLARQLVSLTLGAPPTTDAPHPVDPGSWAGEATPRPARREAVSGSG